MLQRTERGGDVLVALFQSLTNGDEDVASPFHGRGGDVLIAMGMALERRRGRRHPVAFRDSVKMRPLLPDPKQTLAVPPAADVYSARQGPWSVD